MPENLEKLKRLLAEVFQLDQAELDFGIYRIMNAKRDEITRFLDNDLLPQVREAFQAYEAENRGAVEAELAEAIEKAKELGADPETLPRVKELRAKLAEAVDVTALENEVYSHLYNFFRRYYQEGDFISLRRYKEGVYAIPYEGEELKLHWANHDQYYIKTSEYLRNYTFKLPSGKRVHFKLVEADTEKDNNRAANGTERRFILSAEQPLAEESGELVIRFEYRPHPDNAKQADLNAAAVDRILNRTTGFDDWRRELASLRPTEKNPNRTLLEKHLTDYTARNTFDYFIHKDLGGFLRRELDFYIKNEVMHLDDIESETAPRVEQYLAKIKAIRRIAHKLIDFLAQIENFQKKLWLKKKFVVQTHYCITLDRILAIEDEKTRDWLLDQIVRNDAQREEWVRLFAIDEIKGDLTTPGYSNPLEPEFLKAHRTLVVDTRHFDEAFKLRLLAAIPDLDETTDGLLINGENFQAMRLLASRWAASFDCAYIDPPYNTGNDAFIYKDSYRDSSWIAFIDGRLGAFLPLARNDAALFVSIDDNEVGNLVNLVKNHSPSAALVTLVAAQLNPRGRTLDKYLAKTHEYVATFALFGAPDTIHEVKKSEEAQAEYRERDEKGPFRLLELRNRNPVFTRANRPNLFYPFFADPKRGTVRLERDATHTVEILPRNSRGEDGCWTWGREKAQENISELVARQARTGAWRVFRKDRLHSEEGEVATTKAKSIWIDKEINNENGKELVGDLFGQAVFDFPKPVALIERCAEIGMARDGCFIDFFAGSGTSGHAILNLNRRDGGTRRFALVEMGGYFDTVLVPRLKKVIFTPEWKDGKPKRMPTQEEIERSPRILKILRLESYEDTLNNLELKRSGPQQTLLEQHPSFREDYMLRYMLDVESRGSASLLNIDRFEDPFNYKLNIATGTAGETKPTVVDLVETFNYLLGLRVKTIDHIGGVRVVTGTNPQGERVLILWRKTKELENDALDAWFRKQGYNTKDQEYDVIYVNGDNNLENLRKPDQTWKVRLIEEEFRRLMFDVQDV
ncbi:MAG TPA: DNA methyltransferase [Burkholderiales bacterium]|nr:DNA methyltransferase [Burkholderiales bacterium]